MLAEERRNLILEKLQQEGKVVVSELSELFGVSEETIRRDLDKFDKEGIASKTYGGAVLIEDTNTDMPFNIRRKTNMQGKRTIGGIIESLVSDGESIIVDPSTTAVAIMKALRSKKNLTVITNSIEAFNADKVILSCKGLDMQKGVTDANELFTQVKKNMLASAKQKILAVDRTKFNRIAFSQICSITDLDIVVTDVKPSEEWLSYFEEKGIKCLYGEEH